MKFFKIICLVCCLLLPTALHGQGCELFTGNLSCDGLSSCLITVVNQSGSICANTLDYDSNTDICRFNLENCTKTGYLHFKGTSIASEPECISLSQSVDYCTVSGGGGGGCPDPPSAHPPEPKSFQRAFAQAIAIPGHGAFGENRLALLYDDGYGAKTTHRLAFTTMAPFGIEQPVPVYVTRDLPAIFEAEYGYVEVIFDDKYIDDDSLQNFFKIPNAYAAIRLSNGELIGLVEQIHFENWYIDLRQYLARYQHGSSQHIINTNPEEPVMLNLATVFTWTGEEWVTDPLLALETLKDAFPASARQLALLRAATQKPKSE